MEENNTHTETKSEELNFKKIQLEIYLSILSIKDKTTDDEVIKELNLVLKKQLILLNNYGISKKAISDILKYKELLS